ncbi:MAG: hypothetical protein K2H41_02560 [Acetatifactor sp.]|nr:hypothetical protein [Acetatifactor sp.]
MSNFTVNKKMELMRQIRSRYQKDRSDLFRREQLLYGRTSVYPWEEIGMNDLEDEGEPIQTFPLRALLAIVLVLLIIICDMSGKSFLGIRADQCFSAISEDYESSIAAWAETVSDQTGSDKNAVPENPPAGSRP